MNAALCGVSGFAGVAMGACFLSGDKRRENTTTPVVFKLGML